MKTPEFVSRKFGQRGRSFEAVQEITDLVVSEEAKGLFLTMENVGICCASTVRMKANQTLNLANLQNNCKIVPAKVNILSETFVLTAFKESSDAVLVSINNENTKFVIGNTSNLTALELWWEKGRVVAAIADEKGVVRMIDISNLIKTKTVIELFKIEKEGKVAAMAYCKKSQELMVCRNSNLEVWKDSKLLQVIECHSSILSISCSFDWMALSLSDGSIVAINIMSKVMTKPLAIQHSGLVVIGSLIYMITEGSLVMLDMNNLVLRVKKVVVPGKFKLIASNGKVLYLTNGKEVAEYI